MAGFEPATSALSPQHSPTELHADVYGPEGTRTLYLCRAKAALSQMSYQPWDFMEPMGLEPMTFSLPERRAPNCAKAPWSTHQLFRPPSAWCQRSPSRTTSNEIKDLSRSS